MRRSFTAGFKLKVIDDADVHGPNAAALHFNCVERCVRRWQNEREKLETCNRTRRSFRGPRAKWEMLEVELKEWIVQKRSKHHQVSTLKYKKLNE